MVFLVIFGVGLLLAVVTFVVGEIFDLGGGDADTGGLPGAEAGAPSPFSSRILFVFMTAFGGFGYIGQAFDWPVWGAVLFALAGGLLVAGGTFVLIVVPMSKQQGSTRVRQSDFLGLEGEVVAEIPQGAAGRVSVVAPASGARVTHAARSATGERIGQGTRVRVVQVGPGGITVEPATAAARTALSNEGEGER